MTLMAFNAISCFVGPLRDFTVLEEINIDWDLLIPRWKVTITANNLSKVLPPSVRVLTIHDDNGYTDVEYRNLIDALVFIKASKVPCLTDLAFTCRLHKPVFSKVVEKGLLQHCASVGVALKIEQLDERDMSHHPLHQWSGKAFDRALSQQKNRDKSYNRWLDFVALDEWNRIKRERYRNKKG